MVILATGLILFLGVHSLRSGGESLRHALIERLGPLAFKGIYSLLSLVGFVCLVIGFHQVQLAPVVLWTPPSGSAHLAVVLMWISMVLLAAAYVPRNAIKSRLGHPMVLSVKVWALAHLIANGKLGDLVLFSAFLIWAIFNFRAARRRDRAALATPISAASGVENTVPALAIVLGLGTVIWGLLLGGLHQYLVGISPLPF